MSSDRVNNSRARKSTPNVKESKRIASFLDSYLPVSSIPSIEDIDERINYIVGLMFECKWIKGVTGPVIAKAWGVVPGTVEGYAAQASRIVRNSSNPEDTRLSALSVLTTGSLKLFMEAMDRGDAKGAAAIGKLLADVSGANAPTKIAATIEGNATPLSAKRVMDEIFSGGVGKTQETDAVQELEPEPDLVTSLESEPDEQDSNS